LAWIIFIGMIIAATWILATGSNCKNGAINPDTGKYLRTCYGPDVGPDPNQRP